MASTPSSTTHTSHDAIPWPFSALYAHVTIVHTHILKTIDGLYELQTTGKSNQESNQDSTDDIGSSATAFDDAGAWGATIENLVKGISDGSIKPPSTLNVDSSSSSSDDDTGGMLDTIKSDLTAFTSAITWSHDSYWIIPLLLFHFMTLILILKMFRTRTTSTTSLSAVFITLAILARSTGQINSLCSTHHTLFSSQNYFDKRGVFASVFWGFPILVNLMVMVGGIVWEAGRLMVEVKRHEVQRGRVGR